MSMTPITSVSSTEHPAEHWPYINVTGQRVLNLGCGNFGLLNHSQDVDEVGFFLQQQPEHMVGVDMNADDIAALTQRYAPAIHAGQLTLLTQKCETVQSLQHLIDTYQINTIKSDIEGFEFLFEWLPTSYVQKIHRWYIEAHGNNLIRSIKRWADHQGLHLYAQVRLDHGHWPCLVYFFDRDASYGRFMTNRAGDFPRQF